MHALFEILLLSNVFLQETHSLKLFINIYFEPENEYNTKNVCRLGSHNKSLCSFQLNSSSISWKNYFKGAERHKRHSPGTVAIYIYTQTLPLSVWLRGAMVARPTPVEKAHMCMDISEGCVFKSRRGQELFFVWKKHFSHFLLILF